MRETASKINVLIAASECSPFVKTGGLADVIGALPSKLDRSRFDVRVILPKYTCIPEEYRNRMEYVTHFYTGFHFREQYVGLLKLELGGVVYYFIDSEYYFSGEQPYGDVYYDIEKFAFFSRMTLSVLPLLDWKPDIIHCNDWQTGLIPVYLNDSFQGDLYYHKLKTVFTIHNLKFQGIYDIASVQDKTGLSAYYFTSDKLESYQCGNLLKGGLVYSDRITTVSETYANEIQTPEYGEGLDGLLSAKKDRLIGILNGIDETVYSPDKDELLAAPYTWRTFRSKKPVNKAALQKELGLPEKPDAFLIGIVSRLTEQKGFSLVAEIAEELLKDDVQLVILGTGQVYFEDYFHSLSKEHPDKVAFRNTYSETIAHRIYAGSDAFLMPSQFEPCGLSQLIALRYGSLPIVRETGGLKDTVTPYNEYTDEGNGFSFTWFNANDMLHVIRYAIETYRDHPDRYASLIERAMRSDFTWKRSAKKYEKLYRELVRERETELKKLNKERRK